MSKDIKDYLHYYINAIRYRFRYIDSPPGEWTAWVMLTPSRYGRVMDDASVSAIEIELRKLKSMTEEEMKEFLHWDELVKLYTDVKAVRHKNSIDIHYTIETDGEGSYRHTHTINLNELSPAQFHYLLSRGFDLWNLIDERLAIDKETLKG